jgi:ABC-type multidrug transport system fused ATPase/permease subunit
MMLGAFFEVLSIGAVVPFLAFISDPSPFDHYKKIIEFFYFFGATNPANLIIYASLILIILSILACVIRILLSWSVFKFTFLLGAELGMDVYKKTLYQPYTYQIAHNTSEIISNINKVSSVVHGILQPFMLGIVALIISAGIFLLLLLTNASITIGALGFFIIIYTIIIFFTRNKLRGNSEVIAKNETTRVKLVQESFGGIRDIIISNTYKIHIDKFSEINLSLRMAEAFNNFIAISPRFFIESMGLILLVILSCWITYGTNKVSSLIPILGLLGISAQKLLPLIQNIYQAWSTLNGSHQALNDVVENLKKQIPKEHIEIADLSAIKEEKNNVAKILSKWKFINVKKVTYSYPGSVKNVLKKISLQIPRGFVVGFIGKTGGGKSTLIDIIMCLLDPTEGHFFIDNIEINSKNKKIWQSMISHVPQVIFLNDTSILENIALGIEKNCIDINLVYEVAKKAQIYDFIIGLPDGFSTIVGERGVKLSGGQRQRIGIARALYKNLPILVLDEATSSLDDVTEESVMAEFENIGNEITILIVAHRTSTLKKCDLIIELSDGSISRVGDYHQIFNK